MTSPKNRKEKGLKWEREIARMLQKTFPTVWRNREQSQGEPDLSEGLPFVIEAKRHKKCNLRKAFSEATGYVNKTGDARPPIAICRDNYQPAEEAFVVMHLSDWLAWVDMIWGWSSADKDTDWDGFVRRLFEPDDT